MNLKKLLLIALCLWATPVMASSVPQTVDDAYPYVDAASILLTNDIKSFLSGGKSLINWAPVFPRPTVVTAQGYWAAWKSDATAAAKNFPVDKPIYISGQALSVSQTGEDFYVDYASSPSGIDDVQAYLSNNGVNAASSYSAGKTVSLLCFRARNMFQPTDLGGCEDIGSVAQNIFVDAYKDLALIAAGKNGGRLSFSKPAQRMIISAQSCAMQLRKAASEPVSPREMASCRGGE
ncbi:hypothetical protein AZ09_08500 [Acetobacter aceti 1023]|nr:hypothetical protein AZ09_08500 [Acetobacter aceti 1023]